MVLLVSQKISATKVFISRFNLMWNLLADFVKPGVVGTLNIPLFYHYIFYHFSTVVDFSSEKYRGSSAHKNSWYQ